MEKSLMRGMASVALFLTLGGLGSACQNRAVEPQATDEVPVVSRVEEPRGNVTHTISISGETLGLIAKWYSGDANNWLKIKDANPGVVPERLRIGQQLQIPESLAVRRDPMTADFVKKEIAALSKYLGSASASPAAVNLNANSGSPAANPGDASLGDAKDRDHADSERVKALESLGVPQQKTEEVAAPNVPDSSVSKSVEVDRASSVKVPSGSPVQAGIVNHDASNNTAEKEETQEVAPTKNSGAEEDAERQKLLRELLGGK